MSPWLPFLPSQLGMLEGHLADPGSSAWSVALLTELAGPIDVPALERCVLETAAELDALRLRLTGGEEPRQRLADDVEGTVERVVLEPGPDQGSVARALAGQIAERPWDVEAPTPLVRHTILVGDGRVWWLQRALHAVIDGYGGWIMRMRIVERYNHLVHGSPLDETPRHTLAEVLADAHDDPDGPAFWREHLTGCPERLAPSDLARPVADRPHRHVVPLPEEVRLALGEAVGRQALWPYALMAAAGAFTAHVCEETEAVIGTPVLGRSTAAERAVPIQMMTVVPMRVRVDPGETLGQVAARAMADAKAGRPHQRLSTSGFFEALPWAWRTGRFHGPVVNVMPFDTEPEIPGVTVTTTPLQRGPVLDLLFTVHPLADGTFVVECLAHRELYTPDQTRWYAERLVAYLARVARPGAVVADQDARLPEEITAGETMAVPGAPGDVLDELPPWGARVDPRRVPVPGLPDAAPRGFAVSDRRGRPCGWGQVGELVALADGSAWPTGLLVDQAPDGSLVSHGWVDDRRQVHGRYVEAGGVAADLATVPGVTAATCRWEGRHLVARVTTSPDADHDQVTELLRHTAPKGCRLRVELA